MRWQTGIVMEQTGRHVIILTPDGQFKRIKLSRSQNQNPDIGEEIRVPTERTLHGFPKVSWIAIAAAIIMFAVASPLLFMINQPAESAVAYVSIDINPSIELTVSNLDNVLAARAYNSDGSKVLSGLNIKGVKYQEAVSMVGKRAIELGFIKKGSDSTFVISVSPLPNAKIDTVAMERSLLASANAVLAGSQVDGDVSTIHVPVALRERATQKGISPAKYAVLVEAVTSGLPVTEKDMQEKSIEVAIASAGGEPEEIINQAGEEEKFEDKEKTYFAILSRNTTMALEQQGEHEKPAGKATVTDKDPEISGSGDSDTTKTGTKKPGEQILKPSNPDADQNKPSISTGSGQSQEPSSEEVPPAVVTGVPNSGNSSSVDSGTTTPGGGENEDDNSDDIDPEDVYISKPINRDSGTSDNMNILKPNF